MKQNLLWGCLFLFVLTLAAPSTANTTSAAAWQPLNGPFGGSVAALAISPNYPADLTLFAGLRGQGVYRFTSDVADWQAVSPGWHIVDLAISPDYAADKTIFALSGLWTTGFTVHRSTDRGETWQAAPTTFADALGLAVSPNFTNDQTLYLYASSGAPSYISTDGGATFAPLGNWFATHSVNALVFSPDFANDQSLFALVPFDGLYHSQDSGATWSLTALTGSYTALAISPNFANDQTLIATDTNGQLHLSNDGGAGWTTPPLILGVGGQHTLRFSPTFASDRVILAASAADPGPYRSADGGLTWAEAGWYDRSNPHQNGMIGGSVFDLVLAPNQSWSGTAYAATSIGVARSAYSGDSWVQRNNGLPSLTTRAIAAAPNSPDLLLAGTSFHESMRFDTGEPGEYDGSLQVSANGGADWKTVTGRLERVQAVAFSPDFANDETAFAAAGMIGQHGFFDGGVYRSTNGLENWEEVFSNTAVTALALSPNFANDQTVWMAASTYTGSLGVHRSQNAGLSWAQIAPAIHADSIVPSPNFVVDNTIFAATGDSGLQKSMDGGLTWTPLATPTAVTALAISPAYGASQTLFIGAQASVSEAGGIYRSTDGGATWDLLDTGIPSAQNGHNLTIADLTYAVDGTVLAGLRYGDADGAVYRSVDGGTSWQAVGDGLADTAVHDLTTTLSHSFNVYAGVGSGLRHIEVAQGQPAEPGVWFGEGPRGGSANALVVSPNFANDGIVFGGEWQADYQGAQWGMGFMKSKDGGLTWTARPDPMESDYNGTAVHDYALSPNFASDGIGFAATGGGVFRTDDSGEDWHWLGNLDGLGGWLNPIAVAPDFPTSGHIMTGASFYSDALYISWDGGATWTRDDTPSASAAIVYSPNFAADQTAFTAGGGMFKTEDGGLNWNTVLTDPIRSLAVSPNFDADSTLFAGGWGDFYTSPNGGSSWLTRTVAAEVRTIDALAVSPQFGTDNLIFAGADSGLYWSEDGGLTWQLVDGYGGTAVLSLAISPDWPTDPILLVGTHEGVFRLRTADPAGGERKQPTEGFAKLYSSPLALGANDNLLLTGTFNHGIWGSDNGGADWQPFGKQGSTLSSYTDLAISPDYAHDQTIFAAQIQARGIGSSLYRTTDGGQNWASVYSTDSIGSVVLSPQFANDQTVFVAGYERAVERSIDGGETWSAIGSWAANSRGIATQLALPPTYPADETIFAGGSYGFWRLLPGAANWETAVSGLTDEHTIAALAVSPTYVNDQTLFAAANWYDTGFDQQSAVFRSTDGGANWEPFTSGLPDARLTDAALSPLFAIDRTVYTTTNDGELYRSRDGGEGWTLVGNAPERPSFHDVAVTLHGDAFVSSSSGVWRYTTPAQDILINGGFEASGGWEMPMTHYAARYSSDVVYDGRQAAQIGIVNDGNKLAYSSVRQTVSLPTSAITATLSFRIYPISGEAINASQTQLFADGLGVEGLMGVNVGDAQYGLILDSVSGAILETIFWQLSNNQAWETHTFDLSGYAGQTIMLHFGAYNDGLDGKTGFYLDQSALVIEQTDIWANQSFLPIIIGRES